MPLSMFKERVTFLCGFLFAQQTRHVPFIMLYKTSQVQPLNRKIGPGTWRQFTLSLDRQ